MILKIFHIKISQFSYQKVVQSFYFFNRSMQKTLQSKGPNIPSIQKSKKSKNPLTPTHQAISSQDLKFRWGQKLF